MRRASPSPFAASGTGATGWPSARCTTTGARRHFASRMAATGACSRSARRAAHSRSVAGVLRGMGLLERRVSYALPDPLEQFRRRMDERQETEKRRRQALEVWQKAVPIGGTLAERYLRNRSITADLPPTLRFHGACWHASGQRLPVLLALVEREGEARPVGVHRVYLAEPGRKADVDPVKASLGPVGGGAVRLTVGRIGTVGRGQPRVSGDPVVVAEGIETALSLPAALLGSSPSILATLSTSGMTGSRAAGRAARAADHRPRQRRGGTQGRDRARRSCLRPRVDRAVPAPASRPEGLERGPSGRSRDAMTAHAAFEDHEPEAPDPLVHEASPPEPYPLSALGPLRAGRGGDPRQDAGARRHRSPCCPRCGGAGGPADRERRDPRRPVAGFAVRAHDRSVWRAQKCVRPACPGGRAGIRGGTHGGAWPQYRLVAQPARSVGRRAQARPRREGRRTGRRGRPT